MQIIFKQSFAESAVGAVEKDFVLNLSKKERNILCYTARLRVGFSSKKIQSQYFLSVEIKRICCRRLKNQI